MNDVQLPPKELRKPKKKTKKKMMVMMMLQSCFYRKGEREGEGEDDDDDTILYRFSSLYKCYREEKMDQDYTQMINCKFESCEGNSATTLTAAAAEDENLKKKKNDTKTPSPTSFMACLHSRLGFAAGPPFRRSSSRHESERDDTVRRSQQKQTLECMP
jgi:hypothetical protein